MIYTFQPCSGGNKDISSAYKGNGLYRNIPYINILLVYIYTLTILYLRPSSKRPQPLTLRMGTVWYRVENLYDVLVSPKCGAFDRSAGFFPAWSKAVYYIYREREIDIVNLFNLKCGWPLKNVVKESIGSHKRPKWACEHSRALCCLGPPTGAEYPGATFSPL